MIRECTYINLAQDTVKLPYLRVNHANEDILIMDVPAKNVTVTLPDDEDVLNRTIFSYGRLRDQTFTYYCEIVDLLTKHGWDFKIHPDPEIIRLRHVVKLLNKSKEDNK